MNINNWLIIVISITLISCGGGSNTKEEKKITVVPLPPIDTATPSTFTFNDTITWISSAAPAGESLHIAKTTSNGSESEIIYLTSANYNDYKPVISPDGQHIAFFRAFSEGDNFFLWNTAIFVMDIDGSNLRQLTDSQFMNTEPYWSRDGSNKITWNRMIHSSEGDNGTFVYETSINASPGDERKISASQWEWSNSNIEDGRIFVQRNDNYYLMTPNNTLSQYEEISYPDSYHYLHKLTISDDETMIAYMKKNSSTVDDYYGSEIVYAKFDASVPAISDEVVMVPLDATKFSWYVSISEDNKYIIYAEDGKIMLHDVEAGLNGQVSTLSNVEYRYPTFIETSK